MAHVAPISESDPAHAGDVLKEWRGTHVVRGIKFAVVDEGRDVDLGQSWDAGPA